MYVKTNWENLPNTSTPINTSNLNKIENELEFLDGNSSWVSLGNTVYYKKVGNVITVRGYSNGDVALTAGDYKTIATLPQEARPSITLAFPWTLVGVRGAHIGRIKAEDGAIELYSDEANIYWAFTITYVI